MASRSLASRILLIVLAVALVALSGGMAWAAVIDYEARAYVPAGVEVAGTDVSGLTEAEVRETIEEHVSAPLLQPVTVVVDDQTYDYDPRDAVTVDVDAMVEATFAPRRKASFLERLQHDLLGREFSTEIEPLYSIDTTAVTDWVSSVAQKTDRPAEDATAEVEGNRVVVTSEVTGRKTSVKKGSKTLIEALSAEAALGDDSRAVSVPVKKIKAKVTAERFQQTVLVDLSDRRIWLFDGSEVEKSYPCAVGTPGFPTPAGNYEVVLKRYLPTWVNPATDGWGKDMPASIPPGPGNPLGTRAININAPGIRFHGTENIASVGTAASHGCMRMYRTDIEDFYERIEVGTKVFIVP